MRGFLFKNEICHGGIRMDGLESPLEGGLRGLVAWVCDCGDYLRLPGPKQLRPVKCSPQDLNIRHRPLLSGNLVKCRPNA